MAVEAVSQSQKRKSWLVKSLLPRLSVLKACTENCKNTVEKYINQIDGASAQVNLKKNIAVVQLDRPVEDTDLRTAVARAGFTVAGIEQMEA